jgi:hypothetical protein
MNGGVSIKDLIIWSGETRLDQVPSYKYERNAKTLRKSTWDALHYTEALKMSEVIHAEKKNYVEKLI